MEPITSLFIFLEAAVETPAVLAALGGGTQSYVIISCIGVVVLMLVALVVVVVVIRRGKAGKEVTSEIEDNSDPNVCML